jgi:hypothetical protein
MALVWEQIDSARAHRYVGTQELFASADRLDRLAELLQQIDELLGQDRASEMRFVEQLMLTDESSRLLREIRNDGLDVGRIVRHLRLAVLSALELAPAERRGAVPTRSMRSG